MKLVAFSLGLFKSFIFSLQVFGDFWVASPSNPSYGLEVYLCCACAAWWSFNVFILLFALYLW